MTDQQHTHHPDDVAGGTLPTDTERAQGGDDDPIAPATITVREYLEGEEEGPVFLHTHLGALLVTGVNFFSDGPWLRTGHGWLTASWCVAYSDRLYFNKAEAERSAS